jgi:hypothetical protein
VKKFHVFWDVIPCNMAFYPRFAYSSTLKIETEGLLLQNAGNDITDYTASHPKRQQFPGSQS